MVKSITAEENSSQTFQYFVTKTCKQFIEKE